MQDLSFNLQTAVNFVKRTPLAAGSRTFFITDDIELKGLAAHVHCPGVFRRD
jgi:hypothetical protein